MTQERRNYLVERTALITKRIARELVVIDCKYNPGQNPGGQELIDVMRHVQTLANVVDEVLVSLSTEG